MKTNAASLPAAHKRWQIPEQHSQVLRPQAFQKTPSLGWRFIAGLAGMAGLAGLAVAAVMVGPGTKGLRR